MFGKFLKHAALTAIAAGLTAVISLLGDGSVRDFLVSHPYWAFLVPVISGALGALVKYVQGEDAPEPAGK